MPVKEWNVTNNTDTTLVSGLGEPQGLAVDVLGDVYFSDFDSAVIKTWSPATASVKPVFTNTTTGITGLAVDGAGNVFIAVPSQNTVEEWVASSGLLEGFTTNGLNAPYGVAVDAFGSVYVADTHNNAVERPQYKFVYPSFEPYWNTLVSSNYLNNPWSLTVDNGGNIYIADGYDGAIKRWNEFSGTVDAPVASGLGDPTGVAVDNTGNISNT